MKMSTRFKMLERAFFLFEEGLFVVAHQEKSGVAAQYTKWHAGGSFIFARMCMFTSVCVCL